MTGEEVKKICDDHENEYLKHKSKNPFLEGLTLLDNLTTETPNYDTEHDIFYANNIENLTEITEKDVIKLNQLGWHFDSEIECFANFT